MKEHLQVQDLQVNELDAELTPLELEELDALKGGASVSDLYYISTTPILFPRGIPIYIPGPQVIVGP